MIKFWQRSGSRIQIHIAILVRRALSKVCTVPVLLIQHLFKCASFPELLQVGLGPSEENPWGQLVFTYLLTYLLTGVYLLYLLTYVFYRHVLPIAQPSVNAQNERE